MTKEEFYSKCAELLGTETHIEQRHPYYRRNRWNNRSPGSGRFIGFGIIRDFVAFVQVRLHHPIVISENYPDREIAYAALKKAIDDHHAD